MLADDFYLLLEAPVDASQAEIKKAYSELAQICHPDRFAYKPELQKKQTRGSGELTTHMML